MDLFRRMRPPREEILKEAGIQDEADEEIPDIDPGQWLASDDAAEVRWAAVKAGRIKLAGLTEAEQEEIRNLSARPINPGNPRLGKETKLTLVRLWTVAYSMNKAYGYGPDDPRRITAKMIQENNKLGGEITYLGNIISELSGYQRDETETAQLFRVS
jgi:hypothetical protein